MINFSKCTRNYFHWNATVSTTLYQLHNDVKSTCCQVRPKVVRFRPSKINSIRNGENLDQSLIKYTPGQLQSSKVSGLNILDIVFWCVYLFTLYTCVWNVRNVYEFFFPWSLNGNSIRCSIQMHGSDLNRADALWTIQICHLWLINSRWTFELSNKRHRTHSDKSA